MERSYMPNTPGIYRRPRVDALIAEGFDHSLVTVVAGQGYGKTIAVSQYMRNADLRLIWLHLSRRDNDPRRFWHRFVLALAYEFPGLHRRFDKLDFPDTVEKSDSFLQMLSREIDGGGATALVLDNFESIADREVELFVESLIQADMLRLTVILIANRKLPQAVFMPVRGSFRITDRELEFSDEEIHALFSMHGIALNGAEVERIASETARWPLILQLLCAGSHGGAGASTGAAHIHVAAELFGHHFYSPYPREMQLLLITLSLLPGFSPALIKALCADNFAGILDVLLRHPFISYDPEAELFHMQSMYQDFLCRKETLLPDGAKQTACREAGACFLAGGHVYEAMDCFWEGKDYDGFVDALCKMPRRTVSLGLANRVLARLEAIPAGYRAEHPLADFCRACMYMNNMELARAEALLLELAGQLEAAGENDHRVLLGNVCLALADISVAANRVDGLAHIKKAASLLPEGGSLRHREVLVLGNNCAFFLPAGPSEGVPQMVRYIGELCAYNEQLSHGSGCGFELLFAAEAAYYGGDLTAAGRLAYQALEKAGAMGQYDITCNTWFLLMRIAFWYGEYADATRCLTHITDTIDGHGLLELHSLRSSALAWYHLRLGGSKMAKPWISTQVGAERDLPLEYGRSRCITAHYYYDAGELNRAYAILSQPEDAFRLHRGLWHERLQAHILKAGILLDTGEPHAAGQFFHQAYEMTCGDDLYIPLAEFGKITVSLIKQVTKQCEAEYDPAWLAKVYEESWLYAKRSLSLIREYAGANNLKPAPKPVLTEREIETLTYIANGLTRKEAGKLMGITDHAVKKHLAKCYTKLGALNQADAIHIATINGILSEQK